MAMITISRGSPGPGAAQAERLAKELGCCRLGHEVACEAAATYIKKIDDGRARWTKWGFGADWQDSRLYDVVSSLEEISAETACASVATIAKRPEFAVTDAARAGFPDLALATSTRPILITYRERKPLGLEVMARDEIALVRGAVPQDSSYDDEGGRFEIRLQDMVTPVDGPKRMTLGVEPTAPIPAN